MELFICQLISIVVDSIVPYRGTATITEWWRSDEGSPANVNVRDIYIYC